MTFGVTGSFEDIFDLMFGPQQHDAHVVERRRSRFLKSRTGNFDANMAEMMAEGRRLAALSKPQTASKISEAA